MDAKRQAMYEARARIIKALAHPARLLIVDELRAQPRCVCELQSELDLDMSTVSKHLSVLKNAGVVKDEKRGVQVDSGMGQGPALALLLAGPALSLPSMLVINSIMGPKKTFAYVALVVVMATITGMVYGVVMR
jgi:DNA-binding transcriptional ArsR family regulator